MPDQSTRFVSIRTHRGWRAIDSPYEPVQEMLKLAGRSRLQGKGSALLLGAGSGYLVPEIVKSGVRRIMVITGSPFLVECNRQLLEENSVRPCDISFIVAQTVTPNVLEAVRTFFTEEQCSIVQHPRETKAFPELFGPLSMFVQGLQKPYVKREGTNGKTVLFPLSGHIVEPDIHAAFRDKGLRIVSADSFANRNLSPAEVWDTLHDTTPDFVFSINNRGSDKNGLMASACLHAGIPWISWFVDDPGFVISEHEMHATQKRIGLCWDSAGVETCNRLGFSETGLLPLATNLNTFTPGEGCPELAGRIVYVGSPSFGNEEAYFVTLLQDRQAAAVAAHLQESIVSKRCVPTQSEVDNAIDALGLDAHTFTPVGYQRLPAYAVYRANTAYRVQALSALADLRPIVYGDGWEGLLPEGVEVRGYVDYYRELPQVYRSDAVHISLTHLQMRHYPNQRIFDVGACNRIVLGERLSGWNELFGNGFEELLFDDFRDLREKALFLSRDKELRKEYGRALREIIVRKHGIGNRADRILEAVAQ